jgi:hypothetical protein
VIGKSGTSTPWKTFSTLWITISMPWKSRGKVFHAVEKWLAVAFACVAVWFGVVAERWKAEAATARAWAAAVEFESAVALERMAEHGRAD